MSHSCLEKFQPRKKPFPFSLSEPWPKQLCRTTWTIHARDDSVVGKMLKKDYHPKFQGENTLPVNRSTQTHLNQRVNCTPGKEPKEKNLP